MSKLTHIGVACVFACLMGCGQHRWHTAVVRNNSSEYVRVKCARGEHEVGPHEFAAFFLDEKDDWIEVHRTEMPTWPSPLDPGEDWTEEPMAWKHHPRIDESELPNFGAPERK